MQFSTSEVYGNPLEHPQTERYFGNVNPIGIRSCYDEGKRCAETLCFDYMREYGARIKVIRISIPMDRICRWMTVVLFPILSCRL